MLRFLQYLREFSFADLDPKTGQWKRIPVDAMHRAQHQPPENLDTELYDLISKSYAYIGGYPDFQKPSDLPANHTVWYGLDTDHDDKPNAVEFAKDTPFGRKWTGIASDGSLQAKGALMKHMIHTLLTPGNFCETSDAVMHIMITRYRVPCVDNRADVEKVIGKSVTRWLGSHPDGKYPGYNGFYIRNLFGHDHMKILLGKPKV